MVLHLDGDCFFVACELTRRPALRGLPVITGGERGIASAMSYEAKALGITRGMPVFQVRKLFPQVIVLGSDFRLYEHYSRRMYEIVRRFSTVVEEYSVDECFALLRQGFAGQGIFEIAQEIKETLQKELDMTFSVGVAPTKVLAKLASKRDKPSGLVCTDETNFAQELYGMKIGKVWGIGRQTEKVLQAYGIDTVGKFATLDRSFFEQHFASPIFGLWREIRGERVMQVGAGNLSQHKSIQKTRTFHPNTRDASVLFSHLAKNIENAFTYARALGLSASQINIFILSSEFRYRGIDIKLANFVSTPEEVLAKARELLPKLIKPREMYRKTGVTLMDTQESSMSKLDLFGGHEIRDKQTKAHEQVDKINEKWGSRVIALAATLGARESLSLGHLVSKSPNLPSLGDVW